MSEQTNGTVVPAHPLGPTPGIKPVTLQRRPDMLKCEIPLHIGVFFDGTGNNMYEHQPIQKDSNVARLFRAYLDLPLEGYYPAYVPGVGTRFPEIGEDTPKATGAGFGAGGDGRLNFALLHVFNAMHRMLSPVRSYYTSAPTVKALCRNGRRESRVDRTGAYQAPLADFADEAALRAVGMDGFGGLLMDDAGNAYNRTRFFKKAVADLTAKRAATKKPQLCEIFIDVFGFSRGATQARTFCNWLLALFDGETLCGVPARIRFLGLFDTVASVGLPASMGVGAEGHLSWADAPWLRIDARVKNCVHFVSMHENRGAFPVELVRQAGALPANCHEFMFPGMHSDVGGGYAVNEQGRGPNGRDDEKLSQLPLEAMFEAARAAFVPFDKTLAVGREGDPFTVADNVRAAYTAFMSARQEARQVRDWLFEYLAWRYQVRGEYVRLAWRQRASAADRADLEGANRRLLEDVEALVATSGRPAAWPDGSAESAERQRHEARVRGLAPEARAVYERAKTAPLAAGEAVALFADYAHDSYAGFRPFDQLKVFGLDVVPGSWEPQGYLRWRRRYEGDDTRLTMREDGNARGSTAA